VIHQQCLNVIASEIKHARFFSIEDVLVFPFSKTSYPMSMRRSHERYNSAHVTAVSCIMRQSIVGITGQTILLHTLTDYGLKTISLPGRHFKHLFWVKVDLDASLWDTWRLTFGTKKTAIVKFLKDHLLRLISYSLDKDRGILDNDRFNIILLTKMRRTGIQA